MLTKLIVFTLMGIVGDYALNFWSLSQPGNRTLSLLRPYWDELGAGQAALAAGLTTLVAGIVVVLLDGLTGGKGLLKIMMISLLVGFAGDILIGKAKMFGKLLQTWHEGVGVFGSAVYGAFAILLSTTIGYISGDILEDTSINVNTQSFS